MVSSSPHDQGRPEPHQGHGGEFVEPRGDLPGGIAQQRGAETGTHIFRQLVVPAALHGRLHRHSFHRLDAGDHLDQKGLILCPAIETLAQAGPNDRRDKDREQHVTGQRASHYGGQERAVVEHDRKKDQGEKAVEHDGNRRTGQELPDGVQPARPRHRITGAADLEIGQGQAHNVREELRPQAHVNAIRGMGEDVRAQPAEDSLKDRSPPSCPMASTCSVVSPLCTRTLSVTT